MANTQEDDQKPKWNNESHKVLCGALADALAKSGKGATEHKEEIREVLLASGFDFTWEAIRYVPWLFSLPLLDSREAYPAPAL